MIYTVTFNPSLDYIVSVKDFQLGMTNRTYEEQIFPGGKGINVSIVLGNLGLCNRALGFVAGFTGEEIVRRLGEVGVSEEFIRVSGGMSRINIKLKGIEGTEINGCGPDISAEAMEELKEKLKVLKAGDILFLAGSIPSTMPKDSYRTIMKDLSGSGVLVVVDAAGDLLWKVLEHKPFLIKPNHHELGELFGVKLHTIEDVIPYGQELRRQGAQNVLISLAGEGAVMLTADGRIFSAPAPEGELINSVGAGDSMVAGFMSGFLKSGDYRHAFGMGVAAGSASAFSEGLATGTKILSLYEKVNHSIVEHCFN